MGKILSFIGLKWVKWALSVIATLGVLYLIGAGFNAAVIKPIVEKKMAPVRSAFWAMAAQRDSLAMADSLKARQVGELQLTIKALTKKQKAAIDSLSLAFSSELALRQERYQLLIKALTLSNKEKDDSLSRAVVRIDSFYTNGGRSCYREEKQKRDAPGLFPGKEWVLVEIPCKEDLKKIMFWPSQ